MNAGNNTKKAQQIIFLFIHLNVHVKMVKEEHALNWGGRMGVQLPLGIF